MLICGALIEYDIYNQATNIDVKGKEWEEYVVESFIRYTENEKAGCYTPSGKWNLIHPHRPPPLNVSWM